MQQRARRKHMAARKMSAQFASGVLPTSERIRRRGDSRGQSKGVEQAIVRQRIQKSLIALQIVEEDSGAQPHRGQREGLEFGVNSLTRPGDRTARGRTHARKGAAWKNSRGSRGCSSCRNPLPATPTMRWVHRCLAPINHSCTKLVEAAHSAVRAAILQQEFSRESLKKTRFRPLTPQSQLATQHASACSENLLLISCLCQGDWLSDRSPI